MAKKQKNEVLQITLGDIVAAGPAGLFTSTSVHAPLVASGMVEIAGDVTDATGNVATRATQAGIDHVNGASIVKPTTAYVIEDAIPIPSVKGRGRTSSGYPFDQLQIGQSFFVPNTEKRPDAAKSLATTVSAATAKYAIKTDQVETVQVKVYARGEDGKTIVENGHRIIESTIAEDRYVMRETRKFQLRSVDGGARIWRIA